MTQPSTPERKEGGGGWSLLGGEFREPQTADVLKIYEINQNTFSRSVALALYALELSGNLEPADESVLQEVEAKLISARDLTFDYGLTELRIIKELTKRYTPKTVPVLREVRRMAGEINPRQIDPTPMIPQDMAHIVETMLRINIADELGYEVPRPPQRGAVQ
jgi:hypothetical protein